MTAPLIRKLQNFVQLSEAEKQSLLQAEITIRNVEPRHEIAQENEEIEGATLLLEGLACRYKLLPDGRRQILGYMLPGDMCDPRVFLLDRRDHSIATLSRARVANWPRKSILGLTSIYPRITRAFWWCALVEEGIAREWLVSLGKRTALERLSHLVCELYFRLAAVDLVRGESFDFPVTQAELGDTLGLSAVHVNRTLQDMRRKRLIRMAGRRLTVLDLDALSTIAMFRPNYLHLNTKAQRLGIVREQQVAQRTASQSSVAICS